MWINSRAWFKPGTDKMGQLTLLARVPKCLYKNKVVTIEHMDSLDFEAK